MTDVLIIGSGPAGMTAGIYIKRANLDVQIIETVSYTHLRAHEKNSDLYSRSVTQKIECFRK